MRKILSQNLSQPNGGHWYVVETRLGHTEQANLALAVSGLTVWMPVDVKRAANRSRSSKPRRDARIPRFGRYIFLNCLMTPVLQAAILATKGVVEILRECGSEAPAAVPEEQMQWLRSQASVALYKFKHVQGLKVGQKVQIETGPLKNKTGLIKSLDKRGVLQLEVILLGRPVPLLIEAGHVSGELQAKPRSEQAA